MSDNKQSSDKHDENTDPITEQPSVRQPGTRRRVAYAALAGAALGGLASAIAAIFTGKGVADGVKAVVEGAADTVKGVAESVKSTVIEGAADTIKGVTDGILPTIEDVADAVKAAADGTQPTVGVTSEAVKATAESVESSIESTLNSVKAATDGVKFTVESTLGSVRAAAGSIKSTVESTLETVKVAAEGIESTVKGNVATLSGDRIANQVSTPVEKERVVELTRRAEAARPVASGKVDFQEEKVARMQVEDQTAKTQNLELAIAGMSADEQVSTPKPKPEQVSTHPLGEMGNSSPFNATHRVANDATDGGTLVQLLVSQVATELAISYYEQLPAVLLTEIQRIATNPTLEEKQRIRESWAKALEPLAMAIIRSGASFNASGSLAASNGHQKQVD